MAATISSTKHFLRIKLLTVVSFYTVALAWTGALRFSTGAFANPAVCFAFAPDELLTGL